MFCRRTGNYGKKRLSIRIIRNRKRGKFRFFFSQQEVQHFQLNRIAFRCYPFGEVLDI
jgi:hypothetical protein